MATEYHECSVGGCVNKIRKRLFGSYRHAPKIVGETVACRCTVKPCVRCGGDKWLIVIPVCASCRTAGHVALIPLSKGKAILNPPPTPVKVTIGSSFAGPSKINRACPACGLFAGCECPEAVQDDPSEGVCTVRKVALNKRGRFNRVKK